MRKLPSNVSRHVFKRVQTKANGSQVSTSFIVTRPEIPLEHKEFMDFQKIGSFPEGYSSNSSIAVEHSAKGINDKSIYIAYIQNGVITIKKSKPKYRMENHQWINVAAPSGVTDATHVSIIFDGTMPLKKNGESEFITEKDPWVFWINSEHECWAQKLGDENSRFLCAEANCMGISAVRAIWSEVPRFNFGLIIFMLLNGAIYYRQYIDGTWYDASPINFGPANTVYTSIRVNRTWDYRLCIQAKTNEGKLYEMFSQFEGFGSRIVEHLELESINAVGDATGIKYSEKRVREENTSLNEVSTTDNRIRWGQPVYVVYGINIDNGNGNYGKMIQVEFDHPYVISSVTGNDDKWKLTDSNGKEFKSISCTAINDKEMIIGFRNFNLAEGLCSLAYTPGTISTEIVASKAFSYDFLPINLSAENIHIPAVTEAYNE